MDGYGKQFTTTKMGWGIPSLLVWLCLIRFASGQIPTTDELKGSSLAPNAPTIRSFDQILDRRGTVIFRDTPLSEVIYTLSQQWGVNIVAGADVSGSVSGNFRDATLREILDSLLSVNGYGYRLNGTSLLVLKQEQIGPNNPNFRAETMLLPRNMNQEAMGELIQALRVFSTPVGGQLQAVPSTNTLMVYDTPDRIQQMRGMLQSLTGTSNLPGVTEPGITANLGMSNRATTMPSTGDEIITLRPQFVPVAELAKGVELAVGTQATYVTIDNEEALMISGSADTLRRASYIMEQIDRPRPQVRITAYIYDVSLGETERLGFDWSNRMMSQGLDSNGIPINQVRADAGLLTRALPTSLVGNSALVGASTTGGTGGGASAVASAPTGPQYVFRTLSSHFELNTVLQALDETKGAKLLADPHVTVVDRQTASIDIVTKIPIQQLTQTQQGGSIGTTAFEEAGIKLAVTPRIATDNTVLLQVTPEFSVLAGFNNGNPIIDARRATTVVRVANQHTLVIGGLRQKTAVETVSGIPGLMNMKFFGRLFRTHNTEIRESELIVFLQPEIINCQATGLPREQIAADNQKMELSRIPTSCMGPTVPDCRDPHCPYHHPRSRVNCGLPDEGLVCPIENYYVPPPSAMEAPMNPDPTAPPVEPLAPPTPNPSDPEPGAFESPAQPSVAPVSLPPSSPTSAQGMLFPVEVTPIP